MNRSHFLHPKTVKAGRIIALDTSIHKTKRRPRPATWFVIFGTLFSRRSGVAGRENMQLFRVCLSKTFVGVVVTATVDNVFIFRNDVLVAAIRRVPHCHGRRRRRNRQRRLLLLLLLEQVLSSSSSSSWYRTCYCFIEKSRMNLQKAKKIALAPEQGLL